MQWKSLALKEPPSWSWLPSCQVSISQLWQYHRINLQLDCLDTLLFVTLTDRVSVLNSWNVTSILFKLRTLLMYLMDLALNLFIFFWFEDIYWQKISSLEKCLMIKVRFECTPPRKDLSIFKYMCLVYSHTMLWYHMLYFNQLKADFHQSSRNMLAFN